jgi:hypothetical protein
MKQIKESIYRAPNYGANNIKKLTPQQLLQVFESLSWQIEMLCSVMKTHEYRTRTMAELGARKRRELQRYMRKVRRQVVGARKSRSLQKPGILRPDITSAKRKPRKTSSAAINM